MCSCILTLLFFFRKVLLGMQSILEERDVFQTLFSAVQVQCINKAAKKVQLLKKWFIDTLSLLKQVNVNAINFWIESVHCKVKADRTALKSHPKQNESINECSTSEKEPASNVKAKPLSMKKKKGLFWRKLFKKWATGHQIDQIVSELYREKQNGITRQGIEIRN